uniref:Uncharacterized protein n=1 Tax=Rangifer tarandus platyrhynchus TaxID=3082113 RepID=A0ACB0DZP7_RANTA|nr:unnamed protein product [Rangifer tarandus platyrhynchus]
MDRGDWSLPVKWAPATTQAPGLRQPARNTLGEALGVHPGDAVPAGAATFRPETPPRRWPQRAGNCGEMHKPAQTSGTIPALSTDSPGFRAGGGGCPRTRTRAPRVSMARCGPILESAKAQAGSEEAEGGLRGGGGERGEHRRACFPASQQLQPRVLARAPLLPRAPRSGIGRRVPPHSPRECRPRKAPGRALHRHPRQRYPPAPDPPPPPERAARPRSRRLSSDRGPGPGAATVRRAAAGIAA